jgi:hypothetical protein
MHRTQISFTNEQMTMLRTRAASEGRSIADLVRESVDRHAATHAAQPDRQALIARAKAVAGRFRSRAKNRNVSRRHDDYLAEAFR